jgi:plasmid stabilization system protein ParE
LKNVFIDPLAERELADAADYYDTLSNGLGDALLIETGRAFRQLSKAPLSCPIVRGAIRRRPLFKFPYFILYRVTEGSLQIIAIVHQRRGPRYIAARLRGKNKDA